MRKRTNRTKLNTTTKTITKNAVSVVVADGGAATATPGNSTELLQQQYQHQHSSNKITNNKKSNLATIRSHQSHRTCPAHAYAHTKDLSSDAGILAGCSDASNNSSTELLEMDVDDKIAPIFEEDIDEVIDEEAEEEEDDDDDDDDGEEEGDEEEEVEEEDCVEIDVERDDMEFCDTSRKSTYSVKSSVSRYDKLLTLTAPKQPAAMPTSQSFNDNSNVTNAKHKQQKVQRWRGKFKVDKKQTAASIDADKKIATGSQKNIVKRALLSLASGGSSGARPKSTSSLKFGHNKLHFLAVGYKSSQKKKQQQQHTTLNHETNEAGEEAEAATTSKQMSEAATATTTAVTNSTTTTTTKSNLGNIITSLLRTTTL